MEEPKIALTTLMLANLAKRTGVNVADPKVKQRLEAVTGKLADVLGEIPDLTLAEGVFALIVLSTTIVENAEKSQAPVSSKDGEIPKVMQAMGNA